MNAAQPPVIPAQTRLGPVHLTVGDLDRSVAYYDRALGLRVSERLGGRVSLGTAGSREPLLVLEEDPGAQPSDGYTGLFHFALLLPERTDLAHWLAHVARERIQLTGLSDHFVSEAAYMRDPDGHGIEIYSDRPREVWEGQVAARITSEPLDVDAIMRTLDEPVAEPFDGLPTGTTMGHVHLRVSDVAAATGFYRDVLGFALMAGMPSAAFLAAGGYHHHIGANTWESLGRGQAPAGIATLKQATIVLPAADDVARIADAVAATGQAVTVTDAGTVIRDPSGNPLALRVATRR